MLMIYVPTPKVKVAFRSEVKWCLSNNSKTTEVNLTKLHRKIKHNEKVRRAQKLGSCSQGQGYNQVRGQIVPKIVWLINYRSKCDETLPER